MSSSAPISALDQLMDAIEEPPIRHAVAQIIMLSIDAVTDLAQLDEKIYTHYNHSGEQRDETQSEKLWQLEQNVLTAVRRLEKHLKNDIKSQASDADHNDVDMDMDFDFDFGDSSPPLKNEVDINESDVEGAFDFLAAPDKTENSFERWQALKMELETIAYALGSQLQTFDARFALAMETQRYNQALRELNDMGSSLNDGVFVLITTIYEAYLESVDRDRLIPGHKNALSKALHVRRGLAQLRVLIQKNNKIIQNDRLANSDRNKAFADLLYRLNQFIEGDVFQIMRSADRVEFLNFKRKLESQTIVEARLDCEGFDKYLDSLAIVNQRDVLLKHDHDQANDILQLLEAVQPLLEISPHGAAELVVDAFKKAYFLYGLLDPIDDLLDDWNILSPASEIPLSVAAEMGMRLRKQVQTIR